MHIRTIKIDPPFWPNLAEKKGGWIRWTFSPSIISSMLERKGLRNRILGVPKTPKFSACGGLSPPNRAILSDILGYLGVFALETADLGVRSRPTRSDPPLSKISSLEKEGGGSVWIVLMLQIWSGNPLLLHRLPAIEFVKPLNNVKYNFVGLNFFEHFCLLDR